MLYKITADKARTVDFLAVFAEGETRTFNEDEIKSWAQHGGAPPSSLLPEGFEIEFVSEGEEG